MAGSSVLPKNRYHVRSISLPARSHPIALKIEEELNKLRIWETSSSSTSTVTKSETVQHGLVGLVSLYNNVEDLIHSPVTQQALVLNQHEKLVEEVLDESVQLLDVCSTARDFLLMMKEGVDDLQSAIRRKSIGDSSMEMKLAAYMTLRKKVKKNINKSLSELKKMNHKYVSSSSSPLLDLDQHLSVVVRVLREVFCITISIFRSLLMFMSVSSSSKLSKWSLVAKLLQHNKGQVVQTEESNEVVRVDLAISSLYENIHHQNKDATTDVENYKVKLAQERLKALELRFEEVEKGMGCMYKRLIQTRVSLLNIFTQ